MKIVIWIGCSLTYGFIRTLFRQFGIILGGIPSGVLASVIFYTAWKLCKMWDKKQGVYKEPEEEDKDGEEPETACDTPIEADHIKPAKQNLQNDKSTEYEYLGSIDD